jgi:predicted homoserine dehydrogenase-like protein
MQNICEDGYAGNHDPFFQEPSDEYEELQMNTDHLDDGSVVVNFDIFDTENDQVVKQGGYVMVKKDEEEQRFYVLVFNGTGDLVSETLLPFAFEEC